MGGQVWPDLIIRLVTPSSRVTTCGLFIYVKNKHCVPFLYVALGAVARVNQVIFIFIARVYQPCIPGMSVWRLSAAACPLVGLGGVGDIVDEFKDTLT